MKYDCLLFDLDGTLIDSLPDLATAVNLLREELHLPAISLAQVRSYVGDGATALVQRALPEGVFSADHLNRFLELYQQHLCEQTAPYPGIPELLEKTNLPMALVTNKPIEMTRKLLETLELSRHFSVVLGGDSCAAKKPAPEPLLQAMKDLGSAEKRALMIGDHHTDLRSAAAAGIDSIFCSWGYGNDGGENPRFRADTVSSLAALLVKG